MIRLATDGRAGVCRGRRGGGAGKDKIGMEGKE